MALNCKPGDLAVTVNTEFPQNRGHIVRVLHRHINTPEWDWGDVPSWWCVSNEVTVWRMNGKQVHSLEGPIPDRYLRPIDRWIDSTEEEEILVLDKELALAD